MPDKARLGINRLLSKYRNAHISYITDQRYYKAQGPWTIVALRTDDEDTQFAIRNDTGNVYVVESGASVGKPLITITPVNPPLRGSGTGW